MSSAFYFVSSMLINVTVVPFLLSGRSIQTQTNIQNTIGSQLSTGSPMKRNASGLGFSHSRYSKQNIPLHVLSISSPVTRIRWRPPEERHTDQNFHESMLAVATSSISGANAGGNGTCSACIIARV